MKLSFFLPSVPTGWLLARLLTFVQTRRVRSGSLSAKTNSISSIQIPETS